MVVVIVGGRRMGTTLARALAGRGYDVALTWRQSQLEAEEAADAVRSAGTRAITLPLDVTADVPVIEAAMQQVVDQLGRIDGLVMMASRYEAVPFDELTTWAVERQLGVDMRGTFVCMKAVVPHMRAVGGGRIVNFSDWTVPGGRPRYRGMTGYYVAKAGVKALTEAFALELAADNILVNAVAPGPVVPPEDWTEERVVRAAAATPLGRWGGEEPVVDAVMTLLETTYITGETIRVDGGRALR
jgi:NAD(P)-dependent dehydrogenase (short-subunit alcohol dehydrogenase family)